MITKFYKAYWDASEYLIVTATDSDAKQAFFGWGSDRSGIDLSYYGFGTGRGRGDREEWQWRLTPEGVDRMIGHIEKHIDDPSYYAAGKEKRAAQDLLKVLKTMEKRS